MNRREFLRCSIGLGGLVFAGAMGRAALRESEARHAAVRFLAARQSPDGAWRSAHYGAFREGDALTPLVLWALVDSDAPIARGAAWLQRFTDAQAARTEPWSGLAYPLFTASYSAQFFGARGDAARAGFWAGVVDDLRIREPLGWPANDVACGAWSDSPIPPRIVDRALPVPDMVVPNLSATVLGVQAMVAAGRRDEAAAARPFVERCQNFADADAGEFDDGGFIFAPGDPVRNKAGIAGRDAAGRTRFRSYSSATCDGYLALRACGLAREHPRVRAAAAWLQRCGDEHDATREAFLFYRAPALAAMLADVSDTDRLSALTEDLLARQRDDGSWQGAASASCEDDPLLASAFALRAFGAS